MDWQSHQAMILASHRSHACILPVYLWMPQTVKIFVCRWYLPSSLTSDKAQTRRSPPSFPSLHRPVTSFFPFLAVSSKCLVFSRHIVTLFLSFSLSLSTCTLILGSRSTHNCIYTQHASLSRHFWDFLSLSLLRARFRPFTATYLSVLYSSSVTYSLKISYDIYLPVLSVAFDAAYVYTRLNV